MKKYLSLIVLLFLFNSSFSQFGSRYEAVDIALKDGTNLNGFGKIENYDFKFKDLNKKNKQTIEFEDIISAKFTVFSGKNKSVKKQFTLIGFALPPNFNNKIKHRLVEEIFTSDKIKIYGIYALEGGGTTMGPGNGGQVSTSNMRFGNGNGNNYQDYYCAVKNEKYPRTLYTFGNFIRSFRIMGAECFSDCKELSEKIKNKEFTKDNIKEIGDFYNEKCN
jgi:hypothetical protein